MKFFDKLERKFGRYAVANLTRYIIFGYVIGYILEILAMFTNVNLLSWLTLNPALVMKGQVWRLVTWVVTPPSSFSIFTLVMLFFYYSIGNVLEQTLGRFRYNLYIFSGIVMTSLGVMLMYWFSLFTGNTEGIVLLSLYADYFVTTYYLCLSMYLAFAVCYPDMRVMLYFIIPIKIKWMAWFDVALIAFSFVVSNSWVERVVIIISMLNFLIFFLMTRNYRRVSPKEIHRKQQYYKQVRPNPNVTRHKCAICGRTEENGENLEFRFCSKCNGNYEYCQEHLFTHEHIK